MEPDCKGGAPYPDARRDLPQLGVVRHHPQSKLLDLFFVRRFFIAKQIKITASIDHQKGVWIISKPGARNQVLSLNSARQNDNQPPEEVVWTLFFFIRYMRPCTADISRKSSAVSPPCWAGCLCRTRPKFTNMIVAPSNTNERLADLQSF